MYMFVTFVLYGSRVVVADRVARCTLQSCIYMFVTFILHGRVALTAESTLQSHMFLILRLLSAHQLQRRRVSSHFTIHVYFTCIHRASFGFSDKTSHSTFSLCLNLPHWVSKISEKVKLMKKEKLVKLVSLEIEMHKVKAMITVIVIVYWAE